MTVRVQNVGQYYHLVTPGDVESLEYHYANSHHIGFQLFLIPLVWNFLVYPVSSNV